MQFAAESGLREWGFPGIESSAPASICPRAVCPRGETSLGRLRVAVRSSDLPLTGSGLGSLLEDAMVLRLAVSLSVAFFGVPRASEVAALRVSDVCVWTRP